MKSEKQMRPAAQAKNGASQAQLLPRTRAIMAWRDAAAVDGWLVVPKMPGEHWSKACVLNREDFEALCVTRNDQADTLTIWAPDGMQVPTPNPYDWEAVKAGVDKCMACGAKGISPQRLGDGGRVCPDCHAGVGSRLIDPPP